MLSSLVDWAEICSEEDCKAVGLGTLPEEPDGFERGLLGGCTASPRLFMFSCAH
jgi:hypothetical protein